MNPLFGDVPVEDGVIQLGSKDRGCRHCGAVEVTVSACGRVAWWHPGTNCCAAAIRDRVGWREEELAAHLDVRAGLDLAGFAGFRDGGSGFTGVPPQRPEQGGIDAGRQDQESSPAHDGW